MRKLTDFEIRQVRELVGGNDFILLTIPHDVDSWDEGRLLQVPIGLVSTLDAETIEYTIVSLAIQITKREKELEKAEEEALRQCGHVDEGTEK